MGIMLQLQKQLTSLSKAERRIAEVILDDPEFITGATTAEVARRAGVSDPMISRLCRRLGRRSFPDFKVSLAAELAGPASYVSQAVAASDSTEEVINKLVDSRQAALEYIRAELDRRAVDRAVGLLNRAARIEIFGCGAGASIAEDAQHKLFRLGTPVTAYADNIMQRMVAAAADKDSTILIISFTGRTQATVEAADIARRRKARVIAITAAGSPLAEHADVVLSSGMEIEDTTLFIPMSIRIVILTVIDVLLTRCALTRATPVDARLKRIKRSLDDTKL